MDTGSFGYPKPKPKEPVPLEGSGILAGNLVEIPRSLKAAASRPILAAGSPGLYWRSGDLPRALAAFEASLELDPEETSALLAASDIARLTGVHEKHRRYFRRARHFGADEGTLEFWELLREFGQETRGNDDTPRHDREIAIMDSALRLSPHDDDAPLRRGLAYFAKGAHDMAMADMDAILERDPDQTAAYILRALMFASRRQWRRVVADMSELIRLRPEDALDYYHRGQAYHHAGGPPFIRPSGPLCRRP